MGYITQDHARIYCSKRATAQGNNNDFLCANILEDQAQWRDKTKGLSNPVIAKHCMSRQWMDDDARKFKRIGSIKEIGF